MGTTGVRLDRGKEGESTNEPRRFLLLVSEWVDVSGDSTMRELGKVFQLRRMPSLSSIWLH
jgi:endoglucanase Acf2